MIKKSFIFIIVSLFLIASCQLLNVPAQQPTQQQKVETDKTESYDAQKTKKETNPVENKAEKEKKAEEKQEVKQVEKTKK